MNKLVIPNEKQSDQFKLFIFLYQFLGKLKVPDCLCW